MLNDNNTNISNYLKTYIENPDPCYAIMLKGKWGCGKTHFIDKWLDSYKQPDYGKEFIVLEPVKVSLYGLTEVDQITKAIDREMHPFLYSRGIEVTKKVFKLFGKIVLKTNVDFNNNDTDDASFSASLDSLSVLKSKDNDNIKGVRFLIFDDIERCQIDIKELLGYINFFVEHCSCHVVIIGDIEHYTDKDTLNDFKEKTIGREFELIPETQLAVDSFIDEVPRIEMLQRMQNIIVDIFETSQTQNLRVLRQCLYDFKIQIGQIDEQIIQNDKYVLKNLLATFVMVYCEYKGNNNKILKDWPEWGLMKDSEHYVSNMMIIKRLLDKYAHIEQSENVVIFNQKLIKPIISHIEQGVPLKSFIETLLLYEQPSEALDKLYRFYNMENEEFDITLQELTKQIKNNKISNIYELGRAIGILSFIKDNHIQNIPNQTISLLKEKLNNNISNITDKPELFIFRDSFFQGIRSASSERVHLTHTAEDFIQYFNSEFERQEKVLLDDLEIVLNDLHDDNIDSLFPLDKNSPSSHYALSYSLTAIFKNIDANRMIENIYGLSNKSLIQFSKFLAMHYHLDLYSSVAESGEFADDVPILKTIKASLEKELKNKTSVSKYNYKYLIDVISKAIEKAEMLENLK